MPQSVNGRKPAIRCKVHTTRPSSSSEPFQSLTQIPMLHSWLLWKEYCTPTLEGDKERRCQVWAAGLWSLDRILRCWVGRSTTGNVFALSGELVQQETVALSTAEADCVALSQAAQETIWLRWLLTDLGVEATPSDPGGQPRCHRNCKESCGPLQN